MKTKIFLLAAVLCLALAACGAEAPQENPEDNLFALTEGVWRIDGEEGTAYIEMDGQGNFEAYYAGGALEFAGYLEYVDEFGDGNGRYDMYDMAGELIEGFYFDSENQFHMGNYGDKIYIRD